MMRRPTAGFTLVEILVAIVVLGVGVVALLGSSGMVTRMLGEGKRATVATTYAERRLEMFRRAASRTTPTCSDPAIAVGTTKDTSWAAGIGMTEHISITAGSGTRMILDSVTFNTPRGPKSVALRTEVPCF
jgi:prepilin-type N-terminal cleavage/methylation domain-containing protein